MRRNVMVYLVLMLAILLAACSGAEAEPTEVPTAELTVVATDLAFDTDKLEVLVGQPVHLTVQNDGALLHDFSIMEIPHTEESTADPTEGETDEHDMEMADMEMEPELHMAMAPGKSGDMEFTVTEVGEYEFFCTVEGHKEAGMIGTLSVSAP